MVVCVASLSAGEPLEVTSDKFISDEKKHLAIFEGNAKAIQGKSKILAKKFVVYLDRNNTAKEYQAVNNVNFEIISQTDIRVGGGIRIWDFIKRFQRIGLPLLAS